MRRSLSRAIPWRARHTRSDRPTFPLGEPREAEAPAPLSAPRTRARPPRAPKFYARRVPHTTPHDLELQATGAHKMLTTCWNRSSRAPAPLRQRRYFDWSSGPRRLCMPGSTLKQKPDGRTDPQHDSRAQPGWAAGVRRLGGEASGGHSGGRLRRTAAAPSAARRPQPPGPPAPAQSPGGASTNEEGCVRLM